MRSCRCSAGSPFGGGVRGNVGLEASGVLATTSNDESERRERNNHAPDAAAHRTTTTTSLMGCTLAPAG